MHEIKSMNEWQYYLKWMNERKKWMNERMAEWSNEARTRVMNQWATVIKLFGKPSNEMSDGTVWDGTTRTGMS